MLGGKWAYPWGGSYTRRAYTRSSTSVREKVGLSVGEGAYTRRGFIGGEIRYFCCSSFSKNSFYPILFLFSNLYLALQQKDIGFPSLKDLKTE